MTKDEYQNSDHFKDLLDTIKQGIAEKHAIQNTDNLSTEEKDKRIAKLSNSLMSLIREEAICVPVEHINSHLFTKEEIKNHLFLDAKEGKDASQKELIGKLMKDIDEYLGVSEFYNHVTLNPSKLKNIEYEGKGSLIYGNSFGPYFAKEYFQKEFRILWLLKESYITKDSYLIGDRGFHDQAKEYVVDGISLISQNSTHYNLVKLSKAILKILGKISDNASEKEVMGHICILEVNYFPGLYFQSYNSDDKLIGKWAELNEELIKKLIEFYDPQIIIGGKTLDHFFPNGYKAIGENQNHSFENICSGILGSNKLRSFNVLGLSCEDCAGDDDKTTKNYIFKTKENRFLIDAYHPSSGIYKEKYAEEEGKIIKRWIEGEN